jgi:hypothetical protein
LGEGLGQRVLQAVPPPDYPDSGIGPISVLSPNPLVVLLALATFVEGFAVLGEEEQRENRVLDRFSDFHQDLRSIVHIVSRVPCS